MKRDVNVFFYGEGLAPEHAPQTGGDERILTAIKDFTEEEKALLAEFLESKAGK